MGNVAVRYLKDESGATAIEYALIAALVAMAIVAALISLGGTLTNFFGTVTGQLNSAN